ncbi:DUF5988 family protein [Streptomyces pactum]|uniref:Uncharacterized protein n=1 Tax=Streptomyces pactum TaxID=68249 RepID=A0A1S6J3L2_9ACTN|nr:DUF5988 family protein [Streptomyces pactum]AQS66329.1 hypothetical protein B1H29_04765 [Streptomyces pactum]
MTASPASYSTGRTENTIEAVLVGGPADIPAEARNVRLPITGESGLDDKVKLRHRNGYEHFERAPGAVRPDRASPVVFHWTTCTKIAE